MTVTTTCFVNDDGHMVAMVQDYLDIDECLEYNSWGLNGATSGVEYYDNSNGEMKLVGSLNLSEV